MTSDALHAALDDYVANPDGLLWLPPPEPEYLRHYLLWLPPEKIDPWQNRWGSGVRSAAYKTWKHNQFQKKWLNEFYQEDLGVPYTPPAKKSYSGIDQAVGKSESVYQPLPTFPQPKDELGQPLPPSTSKDLIDQALQKMLQSLGIPPELCKPPVFNSDYGKLYEQCSKLQLVLGAKTKAGGGLGQLGLDWKQEAAAMQAEQEAIKAEQEALAKAQLGAKLGAAFQTMKSGLEPLPVPKSWAEGVKQAAEKAQAEATMTESFLKAYESYKPEFPADDNEPGVAIDFTALPDKQSAIAEAETELAAATLRNMFNSVCAGSTPLLGEPLTKSGLWAIMVNVLQQVKLGRSDHIAAGEALVFHDLWTSLLANGAEHTGLPDLAGQITTQPVVMRSMVNSMKPKTIL